MRTAAVVVITSLLAALALGPTGCFRPGPGKAGNTAIIVAGSALVIGAAVKSQYGEEGRGGTSSGGGYPALGSIDPTPGVEAVVLTGAVVAGAALVITGIRGLLQSPGGGHR